MLHRLALTSGLILASAIAFDRAALAENIDVPFSGYVPAEVTFSSSTSGTAEAIISPTSTAMPTKYQSLTSATIAVQSSTAATITVSPPRLVSGPTPDPVGTSHVAFLEFGATSARSDVGGGAAALPAGNTNVQVDMLVERPEAFPPGDYNYVVTLTVTP